MESCVIGKRLFVSQISRLFLLLIMLFVSLGVLANDTSNGNVNVNNGNTKTYGTSGEEEDYSLTNNGTITVKNGGILIVYGDLINNGEIVVESGGVLIVYGDFSSYNYLSVSGTVIVSGDVSISDTVGDTSNDQGSYVNNGGAIVAIGTYTSEDTDVSNNADVYGFEGGSTDDNTTVQDEDDIDENSDLYTLLQTYGFLLDDPSVFSATKVDNDNSITLSCTRNIDGDTIMIAYSLEEDFGTPSKGVYYEEGDEIDGGGTVLYVSETDLTNEEHSPLKWGTTYYYKAWSKLNGKYSSGIAKDATTDSKSTASVTTKVTLISEMWGDDDDDDTNTTWSTSQNTNNNYWETEGEDAAYNSTYGAYITYDDWGNNQGALYNKQNESTATLSCDLDLTDVDGDNDCTLSFYWMSEGAYENQPQQQEQAYGLVELVSSSTTYYITTTGGIETSETEDCRFYNQTSWSSQLICDLSSYVGSDYTLTFYWYNNSYQNMGPQAQGGNTAVGFCIDNIVATGYTTGSSTIDEGENTEPSIISSVLDTEDEAYEVFDFNLTDTNYGTNTVVEQLKFIQGDDNDIDDWTDAIGGAKLYSIENDTYTEVTDVDVDVESTSITFTNEDGFITIDNSSSGGSGTNVSQHYCLKIWLSTNLYDNGIEEGDAFDFVLKNEDDNIITGEGDDFVTGDSESSGAVTIDVVATAIVFSTDPSSTAISGNELSTNPIVAGVDENGNIDADFDETSVTLAMAYSDDAEDVTMSGGSANSVSEGEIDFSSITFTLDDYVASATVTLTATYTGNDANIITTTAESEDIVIYDDVENNNSDQFYINAVSFEDFSSANTQLYGDDNGYRIFSDNTVTLERGESYDISLTVYNAYFITQEGTRTVGPPNNQHEETYYYSEYDQTGYAYVWIDWDHDGTFESDELVNEDSEGTIWSCTSEEENNGGGGGFPGENANTTTFTGTVTVPKDAVTGKDLIMRVYFTTLSDLDEYEYTNTTDNENATEDDVAETEDYYYVNIKTSTNLTWTGKSSSDPTSWNETGNWDLGIIPTYNYNVIIPTSPAGGDYFPEIISTEDSPEMYDLEIESDASVTIGTGSSVTIYGDLTTNDGLTVSNTQDLSGDIYPASLMIAGDVTGDVTEDWELTYDVWWYIAHPISGDLIPDYQASLGAGNYYLYVYDNASLAWSKLTNSTSYDFSATEAVAVGILKDGYTLSYSGTLNNDDSYIYTAETDGYQNIGNPYPSYIDFDAICTSTNSTITQTEEDDYSGYTGYTSYIYTTYNNVRQYATYNTSAGSGLNGGSQYIAPGQCFWVYAAAGEKVEITKDACTNSETGSVSLKSVSSTTTKSKIKLALTNSNTYDEMLIIGDEDNGSDELTKYDSKKRMNSGAIGNLFTIKESTDIAINSLPALYDGEVIPVGYSVSSSGMTDFTLKVSSLTNVDDYDIYLDDLDEGISIDLKETEEYTFTPSTESTNDRFQIRIATSESDEENETTTAIDDTYSNEVSVYASGTSAYVVVTESWLQSSTRMINVYNVTGQLQQEIELNDLETQFTLPDTGVYIIKVISGNMIYNQKVLGN